MKSRSAFRLRRVAMVATALALAACVDMSGGGGSRVATPAATTTVAASTSTAVAPVAAATSPADQQLRDMLSDNSVLANNLAGQPFCTFYAANGTSTRTMAGRTDSGTWSVQNGQVCETLGGYSYCSTFTFNPPAFDTLSVVPVSGSGAFPYSASVASFNNCSSGASATQATAITGGSTSTPGTIPGGPAASVTEVGFGDAGGNPLGTFRNVGGLNWVELNAAGQAVFNFTESTRDANQIYLSDRSRNMEVVIDLLNQQIKAGPFGQPLQPIYFVHSFR